MKILIACECSGVIREAFRARGHDAWSCDLQAADDGSLYHIQGDAIEAIKSQKWDMIGMHPECRYLTVAGIHWNNRGRGWEGTNAALKFVADMWKAAGDTPSYLENPVSIISTHFRKPDQIIQPYQFGEDASKATCLWLHKLPKLILDPAKFIAPRMVNGKPRWANQTDSGQNKLAPSPTRSKDRSRTYPGIADAMAQLWGMAALTASEGETEQLLFKNY